MYMVTPVRVGSAKNASPYLFLCRLAFRRLRYLCLDIFARRFFLIDPILSPCFILDILLQFRTVAVLKNDFIQR